MVSGLPALARTRMAQTTLCTTWAQLHSWIGAEPLERPSPQHKRARCRGWTAQPPRAVEWYQPSARAARNTLRYLFFRQRCGVYVKIRRNRLFCVVPFANARHENDWPTQPWMDACKDDANLPPTRWWSNGHVLCNQQPGHVWGLHFLPELRDMLEAACQAYAIQDVDFCINKRDFPQLRLDGQDPCPFAAPGPPLSEYYGRDHIPVVSFYANGDAWADILWPLPEDWTLSHQKPGDRWCRAAWMKRRDALVFRGSATGRGTTPATNRRLQLATMRDEQAGMDVGVVSWNDRWKCTERGAAPTRPNAATLQRAGIHLVPRVSMEQQRQYRYVLYLAGHCAANRYSQLMRQGSVILKAGDPENEPSQLWFFHRLQPWKDHVPVQADLSDLHQKLAWCREHTKECAAMVARCRQLARTLLSTASILRYVACTLNQLPRPGPPRDHPPAGARALLQDTPTVSEFPPPPPKRRRPC